jgi:hypothetical protein
LLPTGSQLFHVDSFSFNTGMSSKRARRHSSEFATDTTMLPPRLKKLKSRKPTMSQQALESTPSLKVYYDAAFTADSVITPEMPSYIMAKTYVDQYCKFGLSIAQDIC